jgi:hypothetical protein
MSEQPETAPPFLTVLRGSPSDAEIAALVAILASAGGPPPLVGPRSLWGDPAFALRGAAMPSSGAWTSAVRYR